MKQKKKKTRILVVDDSFYMRTIIKNMLLDAGYEIVGEAGTAAEAMEQIKKLNPGLVTLDLILPDNNGTDLLQKIKEEHPEIKIVVVSAVGQELILSKANDLGASDYITKPFEEREVLETIKQVIN